ncbi:hypothetical protein K501DRAFT_228346 [Backusella circina FSU 941]|nr:hypothetical protein K501DRAFT_228346 [Backusella circina FSU 941]
MLDGSIVGVDRFKGHVYWTLQGGPGNGLIKSHSHHATNEQGDSNNNKSKQVEEDEDETEEQEEEQKEEEQESIFLDVLPDIDSFGLDDFDMKSNPNKQNAYKQKPWHDTTTPDIEETDIYYIIEPQDGGSIYIYGDGRPLQKLPFSVKELVSLSPFRTQDGTTYVGSKSTSMIAIDPRTGKILQKYDLDNFEDSLMITRDIPRSQTIFLGRHEYKVAIFDSSKKSWNVTYTEYVPNRLDWGIPVSDIPSDIYVAPDAGSAITGIDLSTGELVWSLDLPYPVVSVFDVYHRQDFTVAVAKQEPPLSLSKGAIGDVLSLMDRSNGINTAYVGVHEGSLYALSINKYPLVQICDWASMYTGRKSSSDNNRLTEKEFVDDNTAGWSETPHPLCCHGCEYHMECLVGQHVVESVVPDKQSALSLSTPMDPFSPNMSLNRREASKTIQVKERRASPFQRSLPRSLDHHIADDDDDLKTNFYNLKSDFTYDNLGKLWKSYFISTSVFAYMYRDRMKSFYELKMLPKWKQMLKKRARAKKAKARINAAARREREKIRMEAKEEEEALRKKKEDEEGEVEVKQEKRKSMRPAPLEKLTSAIIKRAERSKLVPELTKKIFNTGFDLERFKPSKSRVLHLSDTVLGYGSQGTVVYKGQFDGRQVAVKRLLLDFYDVALKEVKLLQESDDHPNVVRYFYKEEYDGFLYIALELCYGSLSSYIERTLPGFHDDIMNPAHILSQFISGLQYLHSLKIVHRDIKPHNILIAPSKTVGTPGVRILISDFGLCKKLDGEQSSFNYTAASPAGTTGWRAPELLAGVLAACSSSDTSLNSHHGDETLMMGGRVKATRAIDIFSAGCVFYYVLTGGDHPFGNRFGRENNILNGSFDLQKLKSVDDSIEAEDLVERMISSQPKQRPTADTILSHPFFWTPAKRLAFLQDASDRFEIEERDPPSPLLQHLEADASAVIGIDWYKRIDRVVANDLGRFRKYDGKRLRDLLRALRNKKHHWQDLPDHVKQVYGEPPTDFLYYFTTRFPRLLLHTYYVVTSDPLLRSEGSLRQYF